MSLEFSIEEKNTKNYGIIKDWGASQYKFSMYDIFPYENAYFTPRMSISTFMGYLLVQDVNYKVERRSSLCFRKGIIIHPYDNT